MFCTWENRAHRYIQWHKIAWNGQCSALQCSGLDGGKDCCLQVQGYPHLQSRGGALAHSDMLVMMIMMGMRVIMVMMMAKILDLYHDDDNHGEYCYRDHEESSLKMMVMGFIVIMTMRLVKMMVIMMTTTMMMISMTTKQTWKQRTTYPPPWLADQL